MMIQMSSYQWQGASGSVVTRLQRTLIWCNRFYCSSRLRNDLSHLMTKPTKWHVHPAKTQISMGVRPVWSESLLSAWRNIECSATSWAHIEDSDQTGWTPRLIWVFTGRKGHFVGFVMRRLIFLCYLYSLELGAGTGSRLLSKTGTWGLIFVLNRTCPYRKKYWSPM